MTQNPADQAVFILLEIRIAAAAKAAPRGAEGGANHNRDDANNGATPWKEAQWTF